jgi:hypothetical protein
LIKSNFVSHTISFDEFCRYRHLTWSRNFNIIIDDVSYGTMVPLADMFNFHPDKINVEWFLDNETKCFTIRANRDIMKDEEIFVSYGSHGNTKYLFYYGFTIQDNSNPLYYAFDYHDESITLDNPIELLDSVVYFRKSKRTSITKLKHEILALERFSKELVRLLKNYPFTIADAKLRLESVKGNKRFNLINIYSYLIEEMELIYSYMKLINDIRRILQEKDMYLLNQRLKQISISPKYINLIEYFIHN